MANTITTEGAAEVMAPISEAAPATPTQEAEPPKATRRSRSKPVALRVVKAEPATPLVPVALPEHRDIAPWLDGVHLPSDITAKLLAARRMGSAKVQDVAEQLFALRGLQVNRTEALA